MVSPTTLSHTFAAISIPVGPNVGILISVLMSVLAVSLVSIRIMPVSQLICLISLFSIPTQILKPIVGWVVIPMTGDHALWARANKSFKN